MVGTFAIPPRSEDAGQRDGGPKTYSASKPNGITGGRGSIATRSRSASRSNARQGTANRVLNYLSAAYSWAGANGYVSKNLPVEQLYCVLSRVLATCRQRALREARTPLPRPALLGAA